MTRGGDARQRPRLAAFFFVARLRAGDGFAARFFAGFATRATVRFTEDFFLTVARLATGLRLGAGLLAARDCFAAGLRLASAFAAGAALAGTGRGAA